jgi:hypothetical protein
MHFSIKKKKKKKKNMLLAFSGYFEKNLMGLNDYDPATMFHMKFLNMWFNR